MTMLGLPLAAAYRENQRAEKRQLLPMARRACGGLRAKHGNEPVSAMSNYLGDFPRRKSGKWRAREARKRLNKRHPGSVRNPNI
jgi:hypothetical protein